MLSRLVGLASEKCKFIPVSCNDTVNTICEIFSEEWQDKCGQCLNNIPYLENMCGKCGVDEARVVISNIIKLLDRHDIVWINLGSEDRPCLHCFVLFKEEEKYYRADSYIDERGMEIHEFDFDMFYDFLRNPNKAKYNKTFNCEQGFCYGWRLVISIPINVT